MNEAFSTILSKVDPFDIYALIVLKSAIFVVLGLLVVGGALENLTEK